MRHFAGCLNKRLLAYRRTHGDCHGFERDLLRPCRQSGMLFSSKSPADRDSMCDDITKLLPLRFLRGVDVNNFDPVTKQRIDTVFDAHNGKPTEFSDSPSKYIIHSRVVDGDSYQIEWEDGHQSRFYKSWVKEALDRWEGIEDEVTPRILWTNLTEQDVRNDPSLSLSFHDILEDSGTERGLKALYQYGLLFVTDTPTEDGGAGVAALASAFSGGSIKKVNSTSLLANYRSGGSEIMLPHGTEGPLRTLYGTVWSTTSAGQADGASVADSAYGQGGLPLHTDMTYHRDPPGLQIFTMVQPGLHGGESVFADGFAAANYLKANYPDAFATLSSIVRTYRCMDKATGWHLEARGPVISARNGLVTGIRHNDLDRLPDLPPYGATTQETDDFYDALTYAHQKWDQVLARDELRLTIGLRPGETAVVANQRCFHARHSFRTSSASPRAVMGCYVSQDELDSRFRVQGLRVF